MGVQGLLEAQQIKGALRRSKDGTFGYCIQCDEEIAEKRLELLPRTPLCKACISGTDARRALEKLNFLTKIFLELVLIKLVTLE